MVWGGINYLRSCWTVVIRNWVVYKKDFVANISPTVADPALLLASLGAGLGPFISEIQGRSYAAFLAPGLIATTALFTAFFECSYGFYVRMTYESVFKAMMTTPLGVKEIIGGEFLWVFLKGSFMALGVGLVLLCLGLIEVPWSLPLLALIGGFTAIPCGALGLLAAALVKNINQFQSVYSFLIAPIYFLSGVFFPLGNFSILEKIVQISPFFHGVRLMQMTAWGEGGLGDVLYHGSLLVGSGLVLGAWAYYRIEKKLVS